MLHILENKQISQEYLSELLKALDEAKAPQNLQISKTTIYHLLTTYFYANRKLIESEREFQLRFKEIITNRHAQLKNKVTKKLSKFTFEFDEHESEINQAQQNSLDLIEKGQQKELKEFIRVKWAKFITDNGIQFLPYDEYFRIKLKQETIYNLKGVKIDKRRFPMIIKLRIRNNKEIIPQGLKTLEQFNPGTFKIRKQIFNNIKEEQVNHQRFLKEILHKYCLPVELMILDNTTLIVRHGPSKSKIISQRKPLPLSLEHLGNQLKQTMSEYYKINKETNIFAFQKLFTKGFEFSDEIPPDNEPQQQLPCIELKELQQLKQFLTNPQSFAQTKLALKALPPEFANVIIRCPIHLSLNIETGEKQPLVQQQPSIDYWVRDKNQEVVTKILDELFTKFSPSLFVIKGTISKLINLSFGEACSLCNTSLDEQTPQYFSYFSNLYYCVDCAESDNTSEKGLRRYKVTDNLVFINAPLEDQRVIQDIDEYKFGRNLKIFENDEGSQLHPISCDGGCHKQVPGPRYIAISCRPGKPRGDGNIDFCSDCFSAFKVKDSVRTSQMIARNAEDELTKDAIFLRVLFNQGYNEY